jgi:Rrf2 family protein
MMSIPRGTQVLIPRSKGAQAVGLVGGSGEGMKLTRASSYALQAVAYMAAQKDKDPIASHIIAQKKKIPERFLLKVLKPLVSAQVLTSVKGPNGGYRLARAAKDINMLEILEAVDGPIRGLAPIGVGDSDTAFSKRLDHVCNQTAEHLRKQLERVKIADLVSKE